MHGKYWQLRDKIMLYIHCCDVWSSWNSHFPTLSTQPIANRGLALIRDNLRKRTRTPQHFCCNPQILKPLTFQPNHLLFPSHEPIRGRIMQEICWAFEGRIDFSNRNPFYLCFCEDCGKTVDSDYKMAAFEAFRVGGDAGGVSWVLGKAHARTNASKPALHAWRSDKNLQLS